MSATINERSAINDAKYWLSNANVLAKNKKPNISALGSDYLEIAYTAIEFVSRIQDSLPDTGNKDIISIAVDDMRIVTGLIKVFIVCGIYPSLGEQKMVRLSPRLPGWKLPEDIPLDYSQSNRSHMISLADKVASVFRKDDDVAHILLVSPLMVDLLALTSQTENFQYLVTRLPTFNAYKFLIQLRSAPKVSALVPKTLSEMVIKRQDAVQTSIDLIIEMNEGALDVNSLSSATLALTTIPPGIDTVSYIEHLGDQLYSSISKPIPLSAEEPASVEGVLTVISDISRRRPSFVGRLRNLIVAPFVSVRDASSIASLEKSANALFRIMKKRGEFADHLESRTIASIWSLICVSTLKTQAITKFVMTLMTTMLEANPKNAIKLISNSLIRHSPPNLEWSVRSEKEYQLLETISTPIEQSLLQQIDDRLAVFNSIILEMTDSAAAKVLITLVHVWAAPSSFKDFVADSSVVRLFTAKAIEGMSTHDGIKKKLFNSPLEIIDLVFSIIDSKFVNPTTTELNDEFVNSQKSTQLELGDSDDDDDDDDNDDDDNDNDNPNHNNSDYSEDTAILEVALTLLGNVQMEAEAEIDLQLTAEQKQQSKSLASDASSSRTIRARADFCYEIANGAERFQNEDNINSTDDAQIKKIAYDAFKEPLAPSRAYGIHLITQLNARGSVPLPEAMSIYKDALSDHDSYVYLNAIKAIEASASVYPAAEVITYLSPALSDSTRLTENSDMVLRAREALSRLLTPVSMAKVSSELIDTSMRDLHASSRELIDVRLRISSASLLGIIVARFPSSFSEIQQNDTLDCALGILSYERKRSDVASVRAATVLSLEIVNAVNEGNFRNLQKSTLTSLISTVRSILSETDDNASKDLAQGVIDSTHFSL